MRGLRHEMAAVRWNGFFYTAYSTFAMRSLFYTQARAVEVCRLSGARVAQRVGIKSSLLDYEWRPDMGVLD